MHRSIVFYKPFGTLTSRSYAQIAREYVDTAPRLPVTTLARSASLLYTPASFAMRGCVYFTGTESGSLFETPVKTTDFLPIAKARFKDVDPFVIAGFASQTRNFARFVPLDILVWRHRELDNVSYRDRERVLRLTLTSLSERQPLWFLSERRILLPVYEPLPLDLDKRQRLCDSGHDLFVTDANDPEWRFWCVYWLE